MTTALQLFWAFFKVGALSFGGAYSFLPLTEREVVTTHGWMSRDEFLDVTGLTQIFPGAISVKYATFVGYKQLGLLGVLIANVATVLPPMILVLGLTALYLKYGKVESVKRGMDIVRFAALGLMVALVVQFLGKTTVTVPGVAIMAVAATAVVFFRLHPGYVILAALLIGGIRAAVPVG
jgi:chromate transporter